MSLFDEDKNMNSSDHDFEKALEYAKSMAGYSNLARCYLALAKKSQPVKKEVHTDPLPVKEDVKEEHQSPLHISEPVDTPKRRGRPPKNESNLIDL